MSNRPKSMRFSRRSRVIDPSELEPQDTEELTWKRKYRQSVNDVDLANKFAEFMPADMRDTFLEHNKSEFETVLEARPRTSSLSNRNGSGLPDDYLNAWQDLDLTPLASPMSERRRSKRLSQFHPRTSTYITSMPPLPTQYQDYAVPSLPPSPPAPVFVERYREPEPVISRYESKDSSRTSKRKNTMLKPMKSFVSFLRRPTFK